MSEERKTQIIRAAAKRFARHGLKKTTLDEISRDVRIGKATIYHYFNSKEVLFSGTIKWESDLFLEQIRNIFNKENVPVGAKLLEYFSYKENLFNHYPLLFSLISSSLSETTNEDEKNILRNLISEETMLLKLILGSVYSGRIESMNPSLPLFVASLSWGFLFGSRVISASDQTEDYQSKDILFRILESILS